MLNPIEKFKVAILHLNSDLLLDSVFCVLFFITLLWENTCMVYSFSGPPIGWWHMGDIQVIYHASLLWCSLFSDFDTEGPDKLFFHIHTFFKEEGDQSKFNGCLWKPVTAVKMHVQKNRFAVWKTRPYSTVNHRKTFDAYCKLQVRITFASFVQQTWKESDLYLLDLHHFHTIKRLL